MLTSVCTGSQFLVQFAKLISLLSENVLSLLPCQ